MAIPPAARTPAVIATTTFAVISRQFTKIVERHLKKKKLPEDPAVYAGIERIDQETGLPIYFRYCPGNVVDVSTLGRTIEELKQMGVNTKFSVMEEPMMMLV